MIEKNEDIVKLEETFEKLKNCLLMILEKEQKKINNLIENKEEILNAAKRLEALKHRKKK